jgi:pimeloyl-ACP methyl ester carboxylesterase
MQRIEGAGVELAYEERGSGPAVLLVHGMGEDHRAWAPLAAELAPVARVIAYDRRGYGESGAPQPYDATTVAEQAEDALHLLTARGAVGAVALGADLGALVVLDLLLRHPGVVRAAVLVDPAAFPLVLQATDALADERSALEAELRERGIDAAVAGWRASRGHAEPEPAPDAAAPAPGAQRAFFADFAGQASLELTRRTLSTIDAPVAILTTPNAPAHVTAAADALARLLPDGLRSPTDDPAVAVRALL